MANISLGVDLPALQNDLNSAVSAISNASKGIASEADKANEKIKTSAQGAASGMGSLQTQFRAAQKEALTLAARFGATSDAALHAAKTAGELKDSLQDQKAIINAFSADSKFTAVAGAMSAAAGSISIVTGAMGLLGTESEDVQQAMLKVQSAIALTQGIAQLKEMGAAFTALGAVINTTVIPSLLTMQGALIASGIGIAVVALGLLVNHLNQVELSSKRAAQAQLDFAESNKAIDTAISKAMANTFKSRELQIRAMSNGYAKEAAMVELSKQKELAAIKEAYNASQKNFFDEQRLKNDSLAVEKYYQKQLADIKSKYTLKPQKAVQAIQIETKVDLNNTSKQVNAALQKDLSERMQLTLKPLVKLEPEVVLNSSWASIQAEKMRVSLQSLNDSFTQAAQQTVVATAGMLGNWITEAASGNYKDPFEALGQLLLQSVGNLMVQLGSQMMLFGLGLQAFQLSITTLNPVVAIAAGAAMVAAGAAISALAAKGLQRNTNTSGGGGGQSLQAAPIVQSPNMNGFRNQNNGMDLNTKVKGNDLLIIVDGAGRIRRR